jgi:hypothetical protein
MKQKKKQKYNDKFIIYVFIGILLVCLIHIPIYFVLLYTGTITLKIEDNLKTANHKDSGLLVGLTNKLEDIKTDIENRATNYFPFYAEINLMMRKIDNASNRFIYNKSLPLKLDSGEYIFKNIENDFYYTITTDSKENLQRKLSTQVKLFNELSNETTAKVNLYMIPSYEYLEFSNQDRYQNMYQYVENFKEQLNDDINVSELKINNLKKYQEYLFKTDHHWNSKGAYQGYLDILSMLNENNPKEYQEGIIKNQKMYGSYAKKAFDKSISDTFTYPNIELEEHKILINQKEKTEVVYKPKSTKKPTTSNEFYDYYIKFYQGQYSEVIFDYNNASKKNLLIISDSYIWPIDEVVASHFNKTHLINLRYPPYDKNKFDYKEYIKNNNIDEVLFVYGMGTMVLDGNNYQIESKIER